MTERRAIFVDRDGTLNQEVHYLRDPDQLVLQSGAASAIRLARARGWMVFVVTNQSAVGRRYLTLETLQAIHERLERLLAREDASVDGIYFCPHVPEDGCTCRKPEPGMLVTAANEHGIKLSESWMVGDAASDLEAGRRAGCQTALVMTGYGQRTLDGNLPAVLVARDLGDAIEAILTRCPAS